MAITMIMDALFWLGGVVAGGFLAYGGWLCLVQQFTIDRKRPRTGEMRNTSEDLRVIHSS
jgi:hypothetical protein